MSAIRTEISYEGTEEAADQMDALLDRLGDLVTAEERAAVATDRLEREVAEAGRASQRASRELREAARSSKLLEDSARGLSIRVTQAETQLNAFGQALSSLGSSVQGFTPELDLFGKSLQSISSGMSVASSLPGMWGIALGSLTSVMGITRSVMSELDRQTKELARSQEEAARSTRSLIDELQRVRQVQRIATGEATVEEIGEAVRHAHDLRAVMQEQLDGAVASLRRLREEQRRSAGASSAVQAAIGRQVQAQRDQIESLRQGLASADEGYQRILETQAEAMRRAMALASEDTQAQWDEEEQFRQPQRRHRAANDNDTGTETLADIEDELQREAAEERYRVAEYERQIQRDIAALRDWQAEQDLAHANARKDAINDEWALVRQLQEHHEKYQKEQREKRLKEAREVTGAIEGSLQQVAAAYVDAFGQAIEGQKTLEEASLDATKAILKSIGEEMVALGIKETLEGFANTVSNPPVAATKIPMGVALIGVGVGLGAAGAAIPSQPSAPAERPRGDEGSSGAGDSMTVINYNQPLIGAGTYAQLNRQLNRQLEMGRGFDTRRAA